MKDNIEKLGISSREAEELIKISKNIEKDYKLLKKGYPIQYLIGYSSFYGHKFLINKKTLIPRYETEFLVEKTIKYIKEYLKNSVSICDLGTGSGCIAITLKKEFPNFVVDGYDISFGVIKLAKKNSLLNDTKINFYLKNILKPLNKKYDVIISNPPYIGYNEEVMDVVKKHEPKRALYAPEDGTLFYRKIINNSIKYLNKQFIIAFEIGSDQGEFIKEMAIKVYPNAKVVLENDLTGRNRYIFIINM